MASLNRLKVIAQHLSPGISALDIPVVLDIIQTYIKLLVLLQNVYSHMTRKIMQKHSKQGSKY